MANRNGAQENEATQKTATQKLAQSTLIRWNSPPGENVESIDFFAKLETEQRKAIAEFIEVTKEPLHVTVRMLQEYQWDLFEAIGQFFGEDDEQQDDDNGGTPLPTIGILRGVDIQKDTRHKYSRQPCTYSSLELDMRRTILETATAENGKRTPRSARTVVLNPVATLEYKPLMNIKPSERFKGEVINQWMNERYSGAFEGIRITPLSASYFNTNIPVIPTNPGAFTIGFEDHVVRTVVAVMDSLLRTWNFQEWCETAECEIGDAEDEEIGNEDCVWAPSYVIKFRNPGEEQDARLIGHVEFLAGQPGALSEAYRLRHTSKWGSLRCVLGDVVQWMLMANLRYSFLVSSDEIVFLRINTEERKIGEKTVLIEPWLHYSEPMKISDTFDAEKRTVPVRMALLHLFWLVVQNEKEKWALPDELGNCLNYAVFTKEKEDWKLRRPYVPEPSNVKKPMVKL